MTGALLSQLTGMRKRYLTKAGPLGSTAIVVSTRRYGDLAGNGERVRRVQNKADGTVGIKADVLR